MKYSFLIFQQNFKVWQHLLSSFLSAPPTKFGDFELMFVLSEKNENDFVQLVASSPAYQNLNIKGTVFSSVKEEDAFLRALPLLEGEHVVLVRGNVTDFPAKIWQAFVQEHIQGFHVVVSRQERFNLIAELGKGFTRLTTKLVYGFEPYDGEADIILLDALALNILQSTPHLSLLFTKLNAWHGLAISSIDIPKQNRRERSVFQPRTFYFFCFSFLFFAAVLALHLSLAFTIGLSISIHILLAGIEICSGALLVYFSLRLYFLLHYGALKERERASIIKNYDR